MSNVTIQKLALSLLAGSICLTTMGPVAMAGGSGYGGQGGYHKGFENMTPEQKQAWEEKREARHAKMKQELGLSQEQADKLKAIREQNHGQAKTLHDQMQAKRKTLMEYMSSDSADPAKAHAMQQDIDQIQGKLSELRMNTWFEMKKNLTPEQLAKMKQLREQHRQNRQNNDNQGKGGGYGGGRFNNDKQ